MQLLMYIICTYTGTQRLVWWTCPTIHHPEQAREHALHAFSPLHLHGVEQVEEPRNRSEKSSVDFAAPPVVCSQLV